MHVAVFFGLAFSQEAPSRHRATSTAWWRSRGRGPGPWSELQRQPLQDVEDFFAIR